MCTADPTEADAEIFDMKSINYSFSLYNSNSQDRTSLHCIAEIRAFQLKQKLLISTTLDIITRLLDNTALFVVTWWEDFLKIFRKYVCV